MPKKSRPPAYRRRTDGNHKEIREALRKAGWEVYDCSKIGNGIPDLLIGKAKREIAQSLNLEFTWLDFQWWCEIKMPGEKLKKAEQEFFWRAPGPKCIAHSAEEALEFGRKLLEAAK